MRVLIVGSAGFIGRNLAAALLAAGHAVEGWSRRGTPGPAGMVARAVDLLASGGLPAPPQGGWDAAFHLAAHSRPNLPWSRELALENLTLTARVFEHLAARAPGCRAILASSGQVYAPSDAPHGEQDPLGPRGLYGLSKQLSEDFARFHARDLEVLIVRSFNVIGPGMAPGLLVPDLLERLARGEDPLAMRGRDGLRDFLDVRDAAAAYAALLDAPIESGEALNLCSGTATRVSELIRLLCAARGLERRVTFADPAEDVLLGAGERLRRATGWSPRHTLADTAGSIVPAASPPRPPAPSR